MKTAKVLVTANERGEVIVVSENNPDYAHVCVKQTMVKFDDKGWAKKKTVSALIHGTVEDLKELELSEGDVLPGKIVVHESLTPFSEKNIERQYKIAGDTNVVCCVNGEPIFRKTFYTQDINAQDILVAHTNGDAIKEAFEKLETKKDSLNAM